MNNSTPVTQVFSFLLYVLIQLIFLRQVWIFDTAFCWIFVTPLLLLPTNIKDYALLFIAFFLGLTVDIMYDQLGMNAAACVFLAFLRPIVIKTMVGQTTGNDDIKEINLKTVGFQSFSVYVLIMLFAHHLMINIINLSSTIFLLKALNKTLFSVLFTFSIIISLQMLYYTRRKKR